MSEQSISEMLRASVDGLLRAGWQCTVCGKDVADSDGLCPACVIREALPAIERLEAENARLCEAASALHAWLDADRSGMLWCHEEFATNEESEGGQVYLECDYEHQCGDCERLNALGAALAASDREEAGTTPEEQERMMAYHWRDGLHFGRMENGDVRIWRELRPAEPPGNMVEEVYAMIPADEWASIVAGVSAIGDTRDTWDRARHLHDGLPYTSPSEPEEGEP